jgi:F0F1-type ATP synthase assembly protein I
MKNGYRRFITPLYVINITVQALVSLVSPILLMLLFAYLITKYTAAGGWVYVVFIMLGVFSGLYSMVVFIIRAGRALEAIEKQHKEDGNNT